MYLFAYLAIQAGCIVLSFILPKHYKLFFNKDSLTKNKKVAFNVVGYCLLLAGLYFCTLENEFAIALTTFFGILTVAIFLWAMAMSYKKA